MLEDLFASPVLGLEHLWQPMYDPIQKHARFKAIIEGLDLPK